MRGTAVEPALSPARRGGPSGTSTDTGGSLPPSTLTAASDTSRTLDEVCRWAMSGTTAVARASAEATIWEMLSWVGASISPHASTLPARRWSARTGPYAASRSSGPHFQLTPRHDRSSDILVSSTLRLCFASPQWIEVSRVWGMLSTLRSAPARTAAMNWSHENQGPGSSWSDWCHAAETSTCPQMPRWPALRSVTVSLRMGMAYLWQICRVRWAAFSTASYTCGDSHCSGE